MNYNEYSFLGDAIIFNLSGEICLFILHPSSAKPSIIEENSNVGKKIDSTKSNEK